MVLIACAALLGITSGTAVGYTVQADRAPTPLPPLIQQGLAYPKQSAAKAEKLTEREDRRVRTDGDLRRLLVSRPEEATDMADLWYSDDGWLSPAAYAEDFENPSFVLKMLLRADVRRIAMSAWQQGDEPLTSVALMQFRDEQDIASERFLALQKLSIMQVDGFTDRTTPIPGSGNGSIHVFEQSLDGERFHMARGLARRGDIVMDITITHHSPIDRDDVMSLAKEQWERL